MIWKTAGNKALPEQGKEGKYDRVADSAFGKRL